MQVMGVLKYWKGHNIILKRPVIEQEYKRMMQRESRKTSSSSSTAVKPIDWHVDATCLKWKPRNRKQLFTLPTASPP